MYYIYHIPSVKIGVSTRPHSRVRKQGYNDYEILESHWNVDIVSIREKELQKEYGYAIDSVPYSKSYENLRKGTTKKSLSKGGKSPRKHHGQKTRKVFVETIYGETVGVYDSLSQCAREL